MQLDPAPSIYVGRPCHFGLARSRNCTPRVWTHARYGAEVVASMEAALRATLGARAERPLVLIGFSGGGVLAHLLASRFATTTAVVTIASNLDVAAWAAWHDYTPLDGSLNPVDAPPLAPHIVQIHLVGENDRNVPPQLATNALERLQQTPTILAGADHTCCWARVWPSVLDRLR